MYGEIVCESIVELLLQMQLEEGLFTSKDRKAVFYDLGAGVGKPSVAFALALPEYLATCIGIELFDSLH